MTVPADRDRAALASKLRALATLLTTKRNEEPDAEFTYRPHNDREHAFERTGWLLIRAGVAYIAQGDTARAKAHDWASRGFPSAVISEPGRSLGQEDADVVLTSVEQAASSGSDEWERTVQQLDHERRVLDDNARSAESRIHKILHVRPNEGRRSTLLDCANPKCPNTITGIGHDKPRDGRCTRCAQHRYRYPGFEWPLKPSESDDAA